MPNDADAGGLTVGQVATRLGVTVRALHHWDETGLARPSARSAAGYRLYTSEDVERLHRIVVYRELGVGLDRIRAVLDDPDTDVSDVLHQQRAEVAERIARLQGLDAGLQRMIEARERGLLLTNAQQTEIFGPDWDPQRHAAAQGRYGHTAQWTQYAEKSANRDPEEWEAVADQMAKLDSALAEAMGDGVAPGSTRANDLVEQHREGFAAYFTLTREMQVCVGRMYEADPGFAAHYDGVRPGLATWFRSIVDASARAHGIDPDTATWQ